MTYTPSPSLKRRPAIGPAVNTSDGIYARWIPRFFSPAAVRTTVRVGYGLVSPVQALGNYIGGAFVPPSGTALVSRNPAADGAVVFELSLIHISEPTRQAEIS